MFPLANNGDANLTISDANCPSRLDLSFWGIPMIPKTRNFIRSVALILVSIAVSACEFQRAQEASDAQTAMVGMSKEQVLACMGSPVNTAMAGTTEVWTYNSGNGRTDSVGVVNAWGGYGWASGIGSATTTERSCKVDVVMNVGRVSRINYTGPTGGLLTKGEQCGFAVDNCMQQAAAFTPQPTATVVPHYVEPAATTTAIALPSQSYPTRTSTTAADTTPQPVCSKEDHEMARLARQNGYQHNSACD
ncbi:MAG TPA: outer membrane protein assembly factor BamE [Rhizomicrobium sp.]|nr:outer membrane protein assembly factor BamE [Rhizomicrobium sp.]